MFSEKHQADCGSIWTRFLVIAVLSCRTNGFVATGPVITVICVVCREMERDLRHGRNPMRHAVNLCVGMEEITALGSRTRA